MFEANLSFFSSTNQSTIQTSIHPSCASQQFYLPLSPEIHGPIKTLFGVATGAQSKGCASVSEHSFSEALPVFLNAVEAVHRAR